MTARIANPAALVPDLLKAMLGLEGAIRTSGLDHGLLELVKMRVSQINRCAFCLHLHATELQKSGENPMRVHMLPAWRESSAFTPREKAALGWAEVITLLAETQAPDAEYDALREQFTETEQVQLTMAIGAINVWNRLQVGFRGGHPAVSMSHAA
ncbi:MAG TPA: carboxymuconolactone decarboxylase family protein [Gemmatimonas sp.]|uniref:carboxymuconolactone decarboxylase family protein n=1 Tax=Gemmatimonas sp. TaxID=1962908 RepID=UPI002EDADF04